LISFQGESGSPTSKSPKGQASLKRTLRYWLQIPAFEAHVLELREILRTKAREEALQFGIADIRERLRGLNEDRDKLLQIIAERGQDPIMEGVVDTENCVRIENAGFSLGMRGSSFGTRIIQKQVSR
jgi:hypothetical protein